MLSYGIQALFVLASLLHLAGCWQGRERLCTITKPMLILLLLGCYVSGDPRPPDLCLAGALLASWIGDVLLMPRGDGWFAAGGTAFMIAHVLFVLVYSQQLRTDMISAAVLLPAAAVYLAASAAVMCRIRRALSAWMRAPVLFYLLCNTVMNLFALTQLTAAPSTGSLATFVGAALFFISDCTLFLVRFDRRGARLFKPSFVIMLTYLLGEMLITLGMTLIYRGLPAA